MSLNLSVFPSDSVSFYQEGGEYTTLYSGGCTGPGMASDNCSAVCTNVSQVFNSYPTFQNCADFPWISQELLPGSPLDIRIGNEFGIGINASVISQEITDVIANCVASFCNSYAGCGSCMDPDGGNTYGCCSRNFTIPRNMIDPGRPRTCIPSICSTLELTANSDICGSGVRPK
jgi:hypothetical protein